VIGLASEPNHDWLRRHDVVPVTYGDGQAERIREAAGGKIDAFIDTFGGGYVDSATPTASWPPATATARSCCCPDARTASAIRSKGVRCPR
jgi:hypothetical protein